jgi:hypothetical protein
MGVEGIHRTAAGVVVEVTPDEVVLQLFPVGIGIGTVAAAIDIATDAGIDAHGIAEVDPAGNIVAAIDVFHLADAYQYSGSKALGEMIAFGREHIVHKGRAGLVLRGIYVGLTTAAIDIIHLDV